ncbi:hypothetical protein ENSA7_23960 [Enhygromyxa salina]|uniref:Uncharacterized protein n=2 Tax=Enhygromyxa salina TaxID=215803 RepID=A0A2S9YS80_9BACT|nr:hypothetical protein ENSA7_23960 [Enhygromyxa salina]
MSLQGSPSTGQARCCESDFGLDAALLARSCGFRAYLGESEELACVHRFEDAHGQTREFRLTPIVDLGFEAAIALHEGAALEAGPHPELPMTWISTSETHRWALIPGWSATRRLSWEKATCDVEHMRPVLAAMAAAAPVHAPITPLPRLEFDAPSDAAIEPDSLLARYAAMSSDAAMPTHYPLPRAAAALVDHVLLAAAANDLAAFTERLGPGARWGLPDRRQLSGRAILSDGGTAAIQALRQTARRLSGQLQLHCPKIDRRMVPAVRTGEALMWCVWASADGLDLLVFALRGHTVDGRADATIEYLGVFPRPPSSPLRVLGEPPPPPARPQPTLVCGDPHAVDYPGQCPPTELDDDDDDDDDDESESEPDGSDSDYRR